jgi:hypothetical protein
LQRKDQYRSNASTIFRSTRGHGSDFSRILAILRDVLIEPLIRKPVWNTGHNPHRPHFSQFIIQPFYHLYFMAHIYTTCKVLGSNIPPQSFTTICVFDTTHRTRNHGKNNHLLSFNATRTAKKTRRSTIVLLLRV